MDFTLPRVVYEWMSFVTPTVGTARYYAATDGGCRGAMDIWGTHKKGYKYLQVIELRGRDK